MTQKSSLEAPVGSPDTRESIDEEWFVAGERASSPPPRSTRRPSAPASPSAEAAVPLGDTIADDWFR
jgi:hypothetical protein